MTWQDPMNDTQQKETRRRIKNCLKVLVKELKSRGLNVTSKDENTLIVNGMTFTATDQLSDTYNDVCYLLTDYNQLIECTASRIDDCADTIEEILNVQVEKMKFSQTNRTKWSSNMRKSDYDDNTIFVEECYRRANSSNRPISALLDCYRRYEISDPIADQVANDKEALRWLDDYWAFVCMNEHGNQCNMFDVGGFVGFAYIFQNPQQYIEYLSRMGDYENLTDREIDLIERLKNIAPRYGGMVKSFNDLVRAHKQSI